MDFDIAQIDEVLSTARSVRRNLDFDRPVEAALLLECIDVAVQAPTGMLGEAWRFMVVRDASRKARLADLYRDQLVALLDARGMSMKPTHRALVDRLPDIPAMIFVCMQGEPHQESVSGQVAYYGSVLPAAWSLMLALRARGLGTTWTSLLSARQEEVADVLRIPQGVIQTVMLPVAWMKGATLRRAERMPATSVTFWDTWGEAGSGSSS